MDCFDLAAKHEHRLAKAFSGTTTRFCVVFFTFDWLLPAAGNSEIVHALNASGSLLVLWEIETNRRHDVFPPNEPKILPLTALGRM